MMLKDSFIKKYNNHLFSWYDFLYSFFFVIVLPNFLLWVVAYFFGLARPLLNFDYIPVFILIIWNIRVCKILA